MQFVHHDLGQCKGGETVEITLKGNAANVQLMSSSDFSNYKAGRRYNYVGGLAKRSPVRLRVPRSGRWHVAVDMRGMRGSVRSSARIIPSALPPLREAPLSSVPSLVQPESPPGLGDSLREYDVFISHASEDKSSIVRALADALVAEDLSVWYDEFELRIGDSLRRKIDLGLAKSRVGLVVLSKSFMSKGWTNYELDGIVTRSVTGEQILLPIWHEVTKSEVVAFSPSIADEVARSTATHTVEEIAEEIAGLLKSHAA
ncbi:MAG: DUF1883 domain-containing protein [Bacteroidota bacterium]